MILKISLLLCFIFIGDSIHVDYIETGRKLRLLKSIPETTSTHLVKNLRRNFIDLSDLSSLHNITLECAEDMLYLYLAMNDPNSVPPDFLQVIAMSKSLSIQNTLRDSLQ